MYSLTIRSGTKKVQYVTKPSKQSIVDGPTITLLIVKKKVFTFVHRKNVALNFQIGMSIPYSTPEATEMF